MQPILAYESRPIRDSVPAWLLLPTIIALAVIATAASVAISVVTGRTSRQMIRIVPLSRARMRSKTALIAIVTFMTAGCARSSPEPGASRKFREITAELAHRKCKITLTTRWLHNQLFYRVVATPDTSWDLLSKDAMVKTSLALIDDSGLKLVAFPVVLTPARYTSGGPTGAIVTQLGANFWVSCGAESVGALVLCSPERSSTHGANSAALATLPRSIFRHRASRLAFGMARHATSLMPAFR